MEAYFSAQLGGQFPDLVICDKRTYEWAVRRIFPEDVADDKMLALDYRWDWTALGESWDAYEADLEEERSET
jgi:hypothetical protein